MEVLLVILGYYSRLNTLINLCMTIHGSAEITGYVILINGTGSSWSQWWLFVGEGYEIQVFV